MLCFSVAAVCQGKVWGRSPTVPELPRGRAAMRSKSVIAAKVAILLSPTTLWAPLQQPPTPWRGAGPTPCVGSDGGVYQCPPAARVVAIRAGRLFDTKAAHMLTRQLVVLSPLP